MTQKLLLDPKVADEDWDLLFAIDWACFSTTPEIAIFTPHGLEPAHRAPNVINFGRAAFGSPTPRLCAQIRTSEIRDPVAFVSCRVYRGPLGVVDGPFAATPKPFSLPYLEDESERVFYEWYWDGSMAARRECMELRVPHVFIQALGTALEWRCQGVATRLIEWALEAAAKEWIARCALQAGAMTTALGFYEKFGFRVVDRRRFVDEARFPGWTSEELVTMVKDL